MVYKLRLPKLIAHRGAKQVAPENTLPAMQAASDLGVKWVECDCRLSSDNYAVIIHDASLQRTTNGRGRVNKHSLKQLQFLTASPDLNAAIKIPTLKQLLELVYANNLGLNLEIKVPPKKINTLCRELLQVMQEVPVRKEKFLISVSSTKSLAIMQGNISAAYGLIMRRWSRNWKKKLMNKKIYSVHLNHKILSEKRVKVLQDAGFKVLAYTVNNAARAQKLYSWGVVSLFSDNLKLLSEAG